MSASSPEANTFLQEICYFIEILKHPPVKVPKENFLAVLPLVSWLQKMQAFGGATFQLVVVGVKLRITNFLHNEQEYLVQ